MDKIKQIGFKAGEKPRRPVIQADTSASKSYASIAYGISEGEIVGLIDGAKSVLLDGTPVMSASGDINIPDVTIQERKGTNDQTHLEGFPAVVNEKQYNNIEMLYTAPFVHYINDTSLDAVGIRFIFGALQRTNPDNGDVSGITIEYAIDVQVDGQGYQELLRTSIVGKYSAGYQRYHRVELPPAEEGWEVRIRRLTPNTTSSYIADKMYLDAVAEILDVKMRYPNTALIGLKFDSERFSNIPKVDFRMRGKIIRVPANYDPVARTYATSGEGTTNGIWNGQFKMAYTTNPAWIFYDLVLNKRYGLGNRIDASMLDKWSLYSIAQYCDVMVPDGEGGLEPRFTCNVYINNRFEAYDCLMQLAGVFRGIMYWSGTAIIAGCDRPQDPVFTYTRANIIGEFNYSGTRTKDRHSVVMVSFDDPRNNYKTEKEVVSDRKAISEIGIRTKDLAAFACTSRGQAQRAGKWALFKEQLETRIVTFALGMDGYIAPVGRIIEIADPLLAGRAIGGRIAAVSDDKTTITLDRDTEVKVGDRLVLNNEEGEQESRQVISVSGRNVTVAIAFENPAVQHVWAIDSDDLQLMRFTVISVSENRSQDSITFTVTALQHEPDLHEAADYSAYIDRNNYSVVDITTQKAPTEVVISSVNRINQGIDLTDLVISWKQAENAVKYHVQWRRDDGNWIQMPLQYGNQVTIENIYHGVYEAQVVAINAAEVNSLPASSLPTPINSKFAEPAVPASLTATGILFGVELNWKFPLYGAQNAAYVEIYWALNGDKSDEKLLGSYAYPTTETTLNGLSPHQTLYFRARLVDRNGVASGYTPWVTATVVADPDKLLEVLNGHIGLEAIDAELSKAIEDNTTGVADAKALADQAKTAAANAQTTATNAGTAAANAQTTATNAANAVAKEVTDRVAAVTAEANARAAALTKEASDRTAAINKEATDRAAALAAQATTLKADSAAKVKALKDEVDPKITSLQDGITKVTTDYKAGDTAVVGQLNAYKTSNDTAVASVLQKAESAVSTGATNSSAITAINGQIATINSTKLDASVISGYYTKGQTDAKAAEIAAGKIEEFNASLVIGGTNLIDIAEVQNLALSGTIVSGANYRGFSLPVKAGEVYSISRPAIESNRLRYVFTEVAPASGVAFFGGTGNSATYDNALKIENIAVPEGAQYLFVYMSNQGETITKLKVERGSKASDWSESPTVVENKLNANSTAIQDTNAEVARVDGVATAANNATTALAGRVSTVEGAVATKAEAAALTALTTRVTNTENTNTSQGTAITTLQNTVNHSTTGLATKASTAALTATNSEVTRIDGVVSGHTNQLTQLTSDITSINGTLATKANASALNDFYSKNQTDAKAAEIAAGQIATYDATLVIGGVNQLLDSEGERSSTATTRREYLLYEKSTHLKDFYEENLNKDVTVSFDMKVAVAGSMTVYSSNGSFHSFSTGVNVTADNVDKWVRYSVTVQPKRNGSNTASTVSTLEFYGTYDTGRIPYVRKVQLEAGNKATDWSPSPRDTQAALDANSTAIQDTQASVVEANGRIDATNAAATKLAGRVSTVEGQVSTKAEAAALSSLTTRVTEAEGVNTSQGSAITTLQNTVNHATTGLATKASSAALTAVDNRVTAVDGRVTTTNSNLTLLTGRVSTVEGALTTKADVSALNDIYTKAETDDKATEIAAGEISKYDASLVIGGVNLLPDSYKSFRVGSVAQTQLVRTILSDGSLRITNAGSLTSSYLANFQSAKTTFTEMIGALQNGEDFTVTLWFKAVDTSSLPTTTPTLHLATGLGYLALNGDPTSLSSGKEVPYSYTRKWVGTITAVSPHLSFTPASLGGGLILTKWKIEKGNRSTDWTPNHNEVQDSINANASAIDTLNSEVTRVDGRVTTESNRITTLAGRVSTVEGSKADVSALNALTTRVGDVEGGLATQATDTTNLTASLAATDKIAKDALPKIGGSGSFKTFKEVLNYYLASSGTSSNIVIQTPITFTANMFRISGKGYNYASTKSVIDFEVSGYAYNTAGSILQHGARNAGTFPLRIRLGMKDNKLCVILSPNGTNFAYPAFAVDAAISYGSVSDTFKDGWSATTITEASLASSGITNIIEPSLLDVKVELDVNAEALSTLDAQVSSIDGLVKGHVTDISNLKTGIAGKADAGALSSLTSRVEAEEGKSTSQGTAITNLTNSVNTLGTDLNNVDTLARLMTSANLVREDPTFNQGTNGVGGYRTNAANILSRVPRPSDNPTTSTHEMQVVSTGHGTSTGSFGGFVASVTSRANAVFVIKYIVKMPVGYRMVAASNSVGVGGSNNFVGSTEGTGKYETYFRVVRCGAEGPFSTSGHVFFTGSPVPTASSPVTFHIASIETYDTTDYNDRSAGVASALSALTSDVSDIEGTVTSQGQAITNLENSVNSPTTGLATKASAQALTTLNNQVQHSTTGLSAVNTKVDNLKATVESPTTGLASKASSAALDTLSNKVNHSTTGLDAIANKTTVLESDVSKALDVITIRDTRSTNELPGFYWNTYGNRRVNEFKYQTAIGVSSFFGGTYCNLETVVYWSNSSGGPIIQTATSGDDPSLYVQRQSSGSGDSAVWTAWKQPIKDLRDDLAGKAAASALNSLTTRVTTAEGNISSEATKLSNLSTTVGNHTTSINTHTSSINGIQAKHTVKINNNGFVTGYGLISTANNGAVVSAFKVDADAFAVGKSGSGILPFVVTTAGQTISGITYPAAGTWINAAYIANATIGTAHIKDLSVTTAKIGDLQVDTLKIKDNAVTVPMSVEYSTDSVTSGDFFSTTVATNALIAEWEARHGPVASLTMARAGGKLRVDCGFNITSDVYCLPPTGDNTPDKAQLRMYVSVYVNGSLAARYRYVSNTPGTTTWPASYRAGFEYALILPPMILPAASGSTTIEVKVGFAGMNGGIRVIQRQTGNGPMITTISNRALAIMELKK